MNENSTPQARPRSPLARWIVLAAAIAVPATWSVASAANGSSPHLVDQSPAAVAEAQAATGPASFVGITPVRVLDTRGAGQTVGVPTAGPIGANKSIDVQVTGLSGIPVEASSVAINVTIDDDATLKSFLTVWPTGDAKPLASTNNAEPGFISPVSALMKVGTGGKITVFNQQGAVNVIIDVTGYFIDPSATTTSTSSTSTTSTTSTTTTTTTPT
jgi:hypothetical protein